MVTVPDVVPDSRICPVAVPADPIVISSTNVGELFSTTRPVPTSSETEDAKLAEEIVFVS